DRGAAMAAGEVDRIDGFDDLDHQVEAVLLALIEAGALQHQVADRLAAVERAEDGDGRVEDVDKGLERLGKFLHGLDDVAEHAVHEAVDVDGEVLEGDMGDVELVGLRVDAPVQLEVGLERRVERGVQGGIDEVQG